MTITNLWASLSTGSSNKAREDNLVGEDDNDQESEVMHSYVVLPGRS